MKKKIQVWGYAIGLAVVEVTSSEMSTLTLYISLVNHFADWVVCELEEGLAACISHIHVCVFSVHALSFSTYLFQLGECTVLKQGTGR